MNLILSKAIEAIGKLPDADQEAIARDLIARMDAQELHRTRVVDARKWLDDVQAYFTDIELAPRNQPPMPAIREQL